MTTREEQAAFKSWLDGICEPHPEQWAARQAQIDQGVTVPLSEKQAQVKRVLDNCRFVAEGKLASAAHVRREWKKHNPWLKENENGNA